MNRAASLALAALLAAPLAACGYHIAGTGGAHASILPATARTIAIPTLLNQTEQPEVEQRLTEALVDEFVARARLEAVADPARADLVLEGWITGLRQDPVSFTERGLFDRLEVTITMRIRLLQTAPEKVLWSQNHYVFRQQYDVPETPEADVDREIVAFEEIADDFARTVTTSILEGF